MTLSWMVRRWCVVEQDEQQDLFVGDPWHMHLVDITMRLDVPRERTLCGDFLPSRPVYRELERLQLKVLCPDCLALARSLRGGKRPTAMPPKSEHGESGQFDLYDAGRNVSHDSL
ncbi:MAG TPA: hypothetical protein ENI17_11300 [Pseudomonas xinjiangensis]|uniref:Uncharacterized protein n=2 Tax=root TaxID=1 RepID=A0A7V1FSZ7_9GAMM|nr:hypothetical protein [Halopseudomonas xinjiangensis]HEC48198.1 hypothetical protein [Halopseudomonas xinjiangensis]